MNIPPSNYSNEILDTKVTHLANGLYGCRIIDLCNNTWIVEGRVEKQYITVNNYEIHI